MLAVSTSRDEEELDVLVTEFNSMNAAEDTGLDEEKGRSLVGHVEGVEVDNLFDTFGQTFQFPIAGNVTCDQ